MWWRKPKKTSKTILACLRDRACAVLFPESVFCTTIGGSKQSYQKHLMQKDTRQAIRWQDVDVPLITSWRRRLNWSLMTVPQSLFQSCSIPVARRSSPRGQQTSIWLAMCGLRAWQDPLFIITWHSVRVQCGNNFVISLLC